MTEVMNALKKVIDFQSYTGSEFFSGYIHLNGKGRGLIEAVSRFVNAASNILNEELFRMVGLAVYPGLRSIYEDYEVEMDLIGEYIQPILEFDFVLEDADVSDEVWAGVSDFSNPRFCILNKAQLVSVGVWFVVCGGLLGHVFLLLDKQEVVIYFSDDPAIGFIGLSEAGKINAFLLAREVLMADSGIGCWVGLQP